MVDRTEPSALEQIAEVLLTHGVEFLVIGGQAEVLCGSPRVTYDVDLCYRRTPGNLERLAGALRELQPTLRGAPPDLPFRIDAQALALGNNFTFRTRLGDLDLLGIVEPLGDYEALVAQAEAHQLGNIELRVMPLDQLICVKEVSWSAQGPPGPASASGDQARSPGVKRLTPFTAPVALMARAACSAVGSRL